MPSASFLLALKSYLLESPSEKARHLPIIFILSPCHAAEHWPSHASTSATACLATLLAAALIPVRDYIAHELYVVFLRSCLIQVP